MRLAGVKTLGGLNDLCLKGFGDRGIQGDRDGNVTHLVHEAGDPLADLWERFHGRSESQMSIDELLRDLR